jgi:hypothetical protein
MAGIILHFGFSSLLKYFLIAFRYFSGTCSVGKLSLLTSVEPFLSRPSVPVVWTPDGEPRPDPWPVPVVPVSPPPKDVLRGPAMGTFRGE